MLEFSLSASHADWLHGSPISPPSVTKHTHLTLLQAHCPPTSTHYHTQPPSPNVQHSETWSCNRVIAKKNKHKQKTKKKQTKKKLHRRTYLHQKLLLPSQMSHWWRSRLIKFLVYRVQRTICGHSWTTMLHCSTSVYGYMLQEKAHASFSFSCSSRHQRNIVQVNSGSSAIWLWSYHKTVQYTGILLWVVRC
jgi:hypothetical protein